MRFMAILLLCLILVVIWGDVLLRFIPHRKENLNSMVTEYQRILTYDSADQLIHVMTANPHA